jgi:predicted DNA-binding transcriptional regulator YafY
VNNNDTKRISRLTAIVTQLQTKRLVTAPELAAKFLVSVRTIYRDIRALEDAGIPIYVEEGKGYSLTEHYRLPPVMFTESEANALIIAEQLVLNNKDSSLIKDYSEAIEKIKSVLTLNIKDKANLLSDRTQFTQIEKIERTSSNLGSTEPAMQV